MKFNVPWLQAVGLVSLQLLASCGGRAVGADSSEESTLDGSVLEVAIDDDVGTDPARLQGRSEDGDVVLGARYLLRVGLGQTYALGFTETPQLASGDRVRVHGERLGGSAFVVKSWELLEEEPGTRAQALTGNAQRTGTRVIALLVHHGQTAPPEEANTLDSLDSLMIGETPSVHKVLAESSFGLVRISYFEPRGNLAVTQPSTCDYVGMGNQAETAATAAGIQLNQFDQVMVIFPYRDDCGFHGRANSGSPLQPVRMSYFNGLPSCGGVSHELLHNFGAVHSHSYACGPQKLAAPSQCTPVSEYGHMTPAEYGNSFDPMGRSRCIQFGSETRRQQQWFGACNVVDVAANATFELTALDAPSNAIQMLRVPLPSTRCPTGLPSCYVAVEYRQPLGALESSSTQDPRIFAGLALSVVGPDGVLGSVYSPYLLDMSPLSLSGFYDAQLLPGRTFSDGDLSIRLLSGNSSRALVKVNLPSQGSQVTRCGDGSTTLPAPLTPASCRDGVKNGSETAIDCGGGSCWPCDDGQACLVNSDCHNRCVSGSCAPQAPTCTDGTRNASETDRDCGGGTCATCAAGQACSWHTDCRGGVCALGFCQLPSSCANGGSPDGNESDVDCGGNICALCERDKHCNTNADCLSNSCVNNACTT